MGLFNWADSDIAAGAWFHLRNGDTKFDVGRPESFHPWLVLVPCSRRTALIHICPKSKLPPRPGQAALEAKRHLDGCGLNRDGWLKVNESRQSAKSGVLHAATFICEESDDLVRKAQAMAATVGR